MYYKLNSFIFIRNVNNYLQIIDKRDDGELLGDYCSYLFVKQLSYLPKDFDVIVNGICSEFSGDIDKNLVKNDAITLFNKLIDFGIVSCGTNEDDFAADVIKYSKIGQDRVLLPKDEWERFQLLNKQQPCLQDIIIEITQKCNERCLHCYIPHENKNIIMRDEDFYNIVDMCSDMKTVVNIRITGGECMTHPSFKKFIRYVKEKGFALVLLTNLTLLDDEIIEILKMSTLSQVQVSMFSLNTMIHDQITTIPGSLEKTLMNIEKLETAGIPVSIATQAMEINKDSIEDLYKYTTSHNIKLRCDWTIISKEDRNCDNLSYRINNMEDYRQICKTRLKYCDGYENELREAMSRTPKSENTHLCNAGTKGLYIDTNLNVHPCPGWDLSVGNLKQETLSDVWNHSEILKKVRNVLLKDFPKCANCDIRNLCSICMAQADLENNAQNYIFEMPNYVCSMYKVIYETIQKEVLDVKHHDDSNSLEH